MDARKPIQDMLFQGHGNYLQHVDSVMAGDIMLKFVKSDFAPVLPVHDSFIMRYTIGENDEFEEDMRRAFHGHFKRDIQKEDKIGVMLPSSFDDKEPNEFTFEERALGPPGYSQWESRN